MTFKTFQRWSLSRGGGGCRRETRKLLVVAEDILRANGSVHQIATYPTGSKLICSYNLDFKSQHLFFPSKQDRASRCINLLVWPWGRQKQVSCRSGCDLSVTARFRTGAARQTARLAAFDHDYFRTIWHRDGGQQCGLGMYTVNSLMPWPLPQSQEPYWVLSKP